LEGVKLFEEDENPYLIKALLLALVAIVYALIRRDAGEYYVNKALQEEIIFFLLFFGSMYLVWFFRYWMPHVTCNGFSGSIGGDPFIVGKYAIFPCGEVYEPVHIPGKLHTLVVPKKHMRKVGRNFVSAVYAKPVPLLNLDEEVQRFLYRGKGRFNTHNIFSGDYSEKFLKKNSDPLKMEETLPEFIEEKENLNRRVNVRNRMIEGDNDLLVEQMKAARELGQDSWWRRFLPKKREEKEE